MRLRLFPEPIHAPCALNLRNWEEDGLSRRATASLEPRLFVSLLFPRGTAGRRHTSSWLLTPSPRSPAFQPTGERRVGLSWGSGRKYVWNVNPH